MSCHKRVTWFDRAIVVLFALAVPAWLVLFGILWIVSGVLP